MTLRFLGTRGYIDERSRRHRRHSTLEIVSMRRTVLIDCGEDWLTTLEALDPEAIVITHAHPDHAGGLRHGAPCPVYAAAEIWETMPRWKLPAREVLRHERARVICGFRITPFAVVHSLRAPAVGYRISAGGARLFYVPDVVSIPREREALSGIDLYVGDGASLTRPILRVREGTLIGHTESSRDAAQDGRGAEGRSGRVLSQEQARRRAAGSGGRATARGVEDHRHRARGDGGHETEPPSSPAWQPPAARGRPPGLRLEEVAVGAWCAPRAEVIAGDDAGSEAFIECWSDGMERPADAAGGARDDDDRVAREPRHALQPVNNCVESRAMSGWHPA